jgi:TonB family protein
MKQSFRLVSHVSAFFVMALSVCGQSSPLRIQQTSELEYPNALAGSTISEGWAHVVITVDAEGVLTDLLVANYTHEAFAKQAVKSLREWKYTPAQENGQPVGARKALTVNFKDSKGGLLVFSTFDMTISSGFRRETVTRAIVEPSELDGRVKVIHAPKPVNPAKLISTATERNVVTLDFFVDEKGEPRMPVVVSSPDDAFSQAAVDALVQWRFSPPTREGKPVATHVKQEIIFSKKKDA